MGRFLTKQQLEARRAAYEPAAGLVLLRDSQSGSYERKGKGLLVHAPSGLYRNSARDVDTQRDVPNSADTDMNKDVPFTGEEDNFDHPLTKKEKQILRWMESVQYMVPWYLEMLRTSESLSRVEELHQLPSRCVECDENGRGVKILCLLFTRT